MKQHYETLGLNEGASQQEIQAAYDRLCNELDPAKHNNEEFFVEEYKKVQEAYKALSNSSILATEKGAKSQKNPGAGSKEKESEPTKAPKVKNQFPTPNKKYFNRKSVLIIALAGILSLGGYVIFNNKDLYQISLLFTKKYNRNQIVFSNGLALLKKDMKPFTGYLQDGEVYGQFVNGKREGLHKIKYKYKGDDLPYTWEVKKSALYGSKRRMKVYPRYLINYGIGKFSENKFIGLWEFRHANGVMHEKGNYEVSESISVNENLFEEIPIHGREGFWETWYRNGQLAKEGFYSNGKPKGEWLEYKSNGQLRVRSIY